MSKSNSKASKELHGALIRCIDLNLKSLEQQLNGAEWGFGLPSGKLTAALDLLEELRELVHSSALVLRNTEVHDKIERHVRYQAECEEHGGPRADPAFAAFKRKARDGRVFTEPEKTRLLDEARELYLPSKRPSR